MFEPINRISRVFPHFPSSPKIRYLEYLWNAVRARNLPRFPFRVSCSLWKYCFKFLREESIRCWKTCTTAFKRTLCHPSRFHRNGNTYHFHDFFGSTGLSFVSFSIVGSMIKVNKERSNFCATSWAKREKRGKFIWNCAVVPSLRGQSCNLCKTIRLSRSCYR